MGEFITPDVLPEDTFCRVLLIPNDPKWIGAVSGALLPMIYPSEWVSFGGLTPEETAARCEIMLQEFWASNGCGENMAKCCTPNPEIKRFDPVTERPQISYDGGETWQGDPSDTQGKIQVLPPLVRSGSPKSKCDAATNAIQHINELITATGENLTTAADVFSLGIAIAEAALGLFLVIVSAGTLSPLVVGLASAIWAAATGVFALGIDGYNAYWTTDKQDLIFCKIVCNIGENGQFTEAQYQSFRSEVKAALPASPALDIVMTTINAGGASAMSQMASYGSWATANCDSCDCTDHCTPDGWVAGYWDNTTWTPRGTIVATGDDWIEIDSFDRGDGQQCIGFTTMDRLTCCAIRYDFLEPVSPSVLRFYNPCGTESNYHTQVEAASIGNPLEATNLFFQMDPGTTWRIRFTFQ